MCRLVDSVPSREPFGALRRQTWRPSSLRPLQRWVKNPVKPFRVPRSAARAHLFTSFSGGSALAGSSPELVPGVSVRAGSGGARACPARFVGTSAGGRAERVDAVQGHPIQGRTFTLFS